MKVIVLVQDSTVGKKDTVVTVADSYAKNFLIPRKIVEEATADALHRLDGRLSKQKLEFDNNVEQANKMKKEIEAISSIGFVMDASADHKMFGSITSKDIADRLNAREINVTKKNICLDKPIKNFGKYTVKIKLFNNIKTAITIEVLE